MGKQSRRLRRRLRNEPWPAGPVDRDVGFLCDWSSSSADEELQVVAHRLRTALDQGMGAMKIGDFEHYWLSRDAGLIFLDRALAKVTSTSLRQHYREMQRRLRNHGGRLVVVAAPRRA